MQRRGPLSLPYTGSLSYNGCQCASPVGSGLERFNVFVRLFITNRPFTLCAMLYEGRLSIERLALAQLLV